MKERYLIRKEIRLGLLKFDREQCSRKIALVLLTVEL
jgi:hypothetical protein